MIDEILNYCELDHEQTQTGETRVLKRSLIVESHYFAENPGEETNFK